MHKARLLLLVALAASRAAARPLAPPPSSAPPRPAAATDAQYDYDVFVIGGGSGGLACAYQVAAQFVGLALTL